jgi:hypothetical protein
MEAAGDAMAMKLFGSVKVMFVAVVLETIV